MADQSTIDEQSGQINPVETSLTMGSTPTVRDRVEAAQRIAVVTKQRYMGDTIVATPFLAHLRRCAPHAQISLITAPSVAIALQNCPHVDQLVPLGVDGKSRLEQASELYRAFRSGAFDAAFLLNRSFHCALISAVARVPVRVGYATELRGPLLTASTPYRFDRHEVESHLQILEAVGWSCRAELPHLWLTDAERQRGEEILRGAGVQVGKRPVIAVQPGANDAPVRAWGWARFAAAADQIQKLTGGQIVVMGGEAERGTAAEMIRAMRSAAVNLTGALELRDALAVLGGISAWVGNDTGMLHAAVAANVPSVGIYGPNKVIRWGYQTELHRSLAVFPDSPASDDVTVRRCLDAVDETDVVAAALSVIAAAREDGHAARRAHAAGGTLFPVPEQGRGLAARRR